VINKEIEAYCIQHSTRPSEVARELASYTCQQIQGSNMLIGEMEAAVVTFLIKLGNVKNVLELGTYTGYSALVMAEQLSDEGTVTTIDINPHTTKIAKEFWDKSVHGKKIRQILKPGVEALLDIEEKFDLIFIDADKKNYSHYLKWALGHLSEKGFIIVDNTLWYGKVLTRGVDQRTDSIIAHNDLVRELEDYIKVLLPIRDGMYLIQRA
jgi:caffeoyl-CoA O-methyltransferase